MKKKLIKTIEAIPCEGPEGLWYLLCGGICTGRREIRKRIL